MQINPHYPAGRSRQRWFAVAMLFAIATVGSAAHAVGFDEKLKAPQMTSVAQVKTQATALAATIEKVRAADPTRLVTDASLAKQRFEVQWKVQRAIDERHPLNELSTLGLTPRNDGAYDVDVKGFPIWDDLQGAMVRILNGDQFENIMRDLSARGFRPEDIQLARNYLGAHSAEHASRAAVASIALGFGRAVKKYDRLGIPVPNAVVYSFAYQRARAETESNQAWLNDFLGELDPQRRRILISFFNEYERQTVWAPENLETGVAYVLEQVRRPDFEQLVEAELKGVAP